jgi:terminase small subunit-like protein
MQNLGRKVLLQRFVPWANWALPTAQENLPFHSHGAYNLTMSRTPKSRVTKALVKPRRRVGRPARYTPELAARICGLIATGSTLRAAAKACGISWRTVARWNVERPEFRAAYEQARETRTLLWAEECIDIVDNAQGDYVTNPKTGKQELN